VSGDAPAINGFSIGMDVSNTVAYIGRTNYDRFLHVGRLQIETATVFFIISSALGPQEMNSDKKNEYLILPSGCSCRIEPYTPKEIILQFIVVLYEKFY
jgi:hypothetical protein